MIVCLCEAVSDRAIQREISRGNTTVLAIQDSCGAGRQCGSCCTDLRRLLDTDSGDEPDAPRGGSSSVLLRR